MKEYIINTLFVQCNTRLCFDDYVIILSCQMPTNPPSTELQLQDIYKDDDLH